MEKIKRWYNQSIEEEKVGIWVAITEIILMFADVAIHFVQAGYCEDIYKDIILLITIIMYAANCGVNRLSNL